MEKRLLVFGSREWTDYDSIEREILARNPDIVIEGEARGADRIARQVCERWSIDFLAYPAQWARYGKSAGPRRNQEMALHGKPTEAIGFNKNILESKGSLDMWNKCCKYHIPCTIYTE
jgi:hypothetical protein